LEPHAKSPTVAAPERSGAEIIRAVAASDFNAENVPALEDFDRLALGAFALHGVAMQQRGARGKPAIRAREEEGRRYATACLANVLGESFEHVAARYEPWLVLITDPEHIDTTEREAALHLAYHHCRETYWPTAKRDAVRAAVRAAGATVGLEFEEACQRFAALALRGTSSAVAYLGNDGRMRVGSRQTREALLRDDRSLRRKRSDRPPRMRAASSDHLVNTPARVQECSDVLDVLDSAEFAALVNAASVRAAKERPGSNRRLVLDRFGALLAERVHHGSGLSTRTLAIESKCSRSHLDRIFKKELARLREFARPATCS
jgi:hypothetical protein